MHISSEGSFGFRRSCTEVRRPTFWWFCVNPGTLPQMPQKGDYRLLANFLRLSSMEKVVLLGGCSSRTLGGLLRKTAVSGAMSGSRAESTCCCSYRCRSTENVDLALTAKALSKIYCYKRDINLSRRFIWSVYHVLRKCTRGDSGVYLHRAGPGAMGHKRFLKGYDRASK